MRKLRISKDLWLPIDGVTQTFAFMGRRGSGKTFAAGKLVEEMLDASAQVVVLDIVGNWWGLRTLANGKPGYPIPVFGGPNGDVPLAPTGGMIVADFIVDTGTSVVLDLSFFRKNQRKEFVIAFAEQLFHRKKTAKSAVHVVIDESQHFCPQRVIGGDERLLGAVSDLVLLGRNYGLGVSLISQRPQKVHKDVLNQTECLFAFQMVGPHERKAIDEWIAEKGIIDADAAALTKLPEGTAIVWSPQWLGVYKQVKIAPKKTLDTSATPKVGDKRVANKPLAPIDLDAISEAMAQTIEQAKANDPKLLQTEIMKLRRQIVDLERGRHRPQPKVEAIKTEVKKIEVPVFRPGEVERIQKMWDGVGKTSDKLKEAIDRAMGDLSTTVGRAGHLADEAKRLLQPTVAVKVKPTVPSPPVSGTGNGRAKMARSEGDEGEFGRGPREILTAVARVYPRPVSRVEISTLSGYRPRSSTYANYLSELRTGGYIEGGQGQPFTLSEKAIAYFEAHGGMPTRSATTEDLYNLWASKLTGSTKNMLRLLIDSYGKGLTRDEIAEASGHTTTSSTFANYLSALKTNGLMEKRGGHFYASDTFFPEIG